MDRADRTTSLAKGTEAPSIGRLMGVWFGLGLQSFGGGMATQLLIRRAFVERHGWITAEEFARWWAICPLSPGINLLGLTVLIGQRLGGALGVVVSLLGLLLPSVSITIVMTASYAAIRAEPLVEAALRGVVPATVGLGLFLCWQLAGPLLRARAAARFGHIMLLFACILAAVWQTIPLVLVLLLAGVVGALSSWWRASGRQSS